MPVPVSASSLLRSLGMLFAVLLPGRRRSRTVARAVALAATDAAARQVDPLGISLLAITPDQGEEFGPAKAAATAALPTIAWTGAGLLIAAAVERLPGPRIVKALALGSGTYALDTLAATYMDKLIAKAEQLADEAGGRGGDGLG